MRTAFECPGFILANVQPYYAVDYIFICQFEGRRTHCHTVLAQPGGAIETFSGRRFEGMNPTLNSSEIGHQLIRGVIRYPVKGCREIRRRRIPNIVIRISSRSTF